MAPRSSRSRGDIGDVGVNFCSLPLLETGNSDGAAWKKLGSDSPQWVWKEAVKSPAELEAVAASVQRLAAAARDSAERAFHGLLQSIDLKAACSDLAAGFASGAGLLAVSHEQSTRKGRRRRRPTVGGQRAGGGGVALVNSSSKKKGLEDVHVDPELRPTVQEMLTRPKSFLALIPSDASVFIAGAFAGASAKTLTAPLDRVKLQLQVAGVQAASGGSAGKLSLLEAFVKIGREEGLLGYWKGNVPQVVRIIPYSAVQLFAYESYKRIFKGDKDELSVPARLAAGACAGMTSTFVTFPLDTLRLRLAVDPNMKTMTQAVWSMAREEGLGSFYRGLGPSLLGIAPYIALNFCVFDLLKKAVPEEYRSRSEASFVAALGAASFATVMCYPLDTVRRQMQMKGSPFKTVAEAIPGIITRDGLGGLYRGFLANGLKTLPTSSIRLTTYDAVKKLMAGGRKDYEALALSKKVKQVV